MSRFHVVTDLTTGEKKEIPFTPDEDADRDAEDAIALAAIEARPYDEKRRAEYPSVEDQLDAIWKALDVLNKSGAELPVETVDMLDNQILAVKEKYPKPSA